MNTHLPGFLVILENEKRSEALNYITQIMKDETHTVLELYEEILTPALNLMQPSGNENIDIWREHARTSIIKTILENMLPFVMEEKKRANSPKGKTVAILCPPDEYHDVGARMAADILTIYGYDTVFIGANTPLRVFEAGLSSMQLDYVAISISNPYHLVATRNIIDGLKKSHDQVKIIIGGSAIAKLQDPGTLLQANYVAEKLSDLADLEGGIINATRI